MKRWGQPIIKCISPSDLFRAGFIALLIFWLRPVHADTSLQLLAPRNPSLPLLATGNGYSAAPRLSSDGRFVVFVSSANDLVAGDNGLFGLDVFLRDRASNTTVLVSANLAGSGGGSEYSADGMVSTNGRYVVFESEADDLVVGDTNDVEDIFVRDLMTGTTRLVSVAIGGALGNNESSEPIITQDGRYVVFISTATNLVGDDTNNIPDVFVRDLLAETTTLVSTGATGLASTFMSSAQITSDGRYVVFVSNARSLAPDVPLTTTGEVYVRDLIAGTTIWASTNAAAIASNFINQPNLPSSHPVLSDDGRFVAFKTGSANGVRATVIVQYDAASGLTTVLHTNGFPQWSFNDDVFGPEMTADGRCVAFVARESGSNTNSCAVWLWDAQTGTNVLVSADGTGLVPTNSISHTPVLSSDGRYVVFASNATNLVGNVVSNGFHLYLRDMQYGTNQLLDADLDGVGSTDMQGAIPSVSADGRSIAFCGPDGKLFGLDKNGAFDVFVRDSVAGNTELISQRSPDLIPQAGNGIASATQLSISADGRWIVFSSYAHDLVPNDTNVVQDVFVRDLLTGTNILVSVGTNGWAASGTISGSPVISADGRFVAYASSASNLVASPVNRFSGIFLFEIATRSNRMVSSTAAGVAPTGDCVAPVISADGTYVTFLSRAPNLGLGTIRRSVSAGTNLFLTGAIGGIEPSMSRDGRFIAYLNGTQIRVWDSLGGSNLYTSPANVTSMSLSPNGNALAYLISPNITLFDLNGKTNVVLFSVQTPNTTQIRGASLWSTNGRFFTFVSSSPSVVNLPQDNNAADDVFLFDRVASKVTMLSVRSSGSTSANRRSESPSISGDGRFVVFRSLATNIVAGQSGLVPNIFLYDRLSGVNSLLSVRGPKPDWSSWVSKPTINARGEKVLFESWSSSIVENDLNRVRDVLLDMIEAALDSDADGIPDVWTTQYFGHPDGQPSDLSRAQDDADGDGLTNLEEYTVGTNPQDPASVLRLQIALTFTDGNAVLRWPAAPGRIYRVQFKANVTDPTWSDLTGTISISLGQASLTVPLSQLSRYYRIIATN